MVKARLALLRTPPLAPYRAMRQKRAASYIAVQAALAGPTTQELVGRPISMRSESLLDSSASD